MFVVDFVMRCWSGARQYFNVVDLLRLMEKKGRLVDWFYHRYFLSEYSF